MSVQGVPKFDTIALGDISVDFKKATISLGGVAAFVDSETGMTHGWVKGDGSVWSKATMVKLKELKDAMERDLARVHFGKETIATNGELSQHGLPFKPGGIGEHVGTEAPSI